MSIRNEDEDQDYRKIQPGSVDDLFGDDELEVNVIDDDSDEIIEETETEDWKEYMVNDDEQVDKAPIISETETNIEEEQEIIEDLLEESEVKEESDVDEYHEFNPSDSLNDEVVEIEEESTESLEEEEEDIPVEDISEDDDEDFDDVIKTPAEEEFERIIEEESKKKPDYIEEYVEPEEEEEELVEVSESEEVEVVEESEPEVEEVKEEPKPVEPMKPSINPDDIEGPDLNVDEYGQEIDLNTTFKEKVKKIFENNPIEVIYHWLEEAKENGEDDLNVVKDFYIHEFAIYKDHIDFSNPMAREHIWIIVAHDYHQYICDKKFDEEGTYIEVPDTIGTGPGERNIIEDDYIAAIKEHKKHIQEKYKQFALDRTIFDISEDEDIENSSVFEDIKTLNREFYDSAFYKILKEVMETDEIVDMRDVKCKVTINEKTSDIPVIDFSTGIRCICIDTSDVDQYNINGMLVSKRLPFPFPLDRDTPIRTRFLYSDDCKECPIAVISALRKLVGYKTYKNRYKIKLNKNYTVAYTTEKAWIDKFEKGDKDSKTSGASTFSGHRLSNMGIGVIAVDKKSEKDRRALRRNQFQPISEYEKQLNRDDYNIYLVLSASVVRNDLRLRDPTYPKNERYVEYTITDYVEHNKLIIEDGFQTICACIIKEHMKRYDVGTNYAISFRLDRDNLLSPSVVGMIDERDGIEPSISRRTPNPMEINKQFILPPSRIAMDGIYPFEKHRIDRDFFSGNSIPRLYTERSLWQNYDITNPRGVIEFVKSRGFQMFTTPAPIMFDVMPYALDIIETGEYIRNIIHVSIPMLSDRDSVDAMNLLSKQQDLEHMKELYGSGGSLTGLQKVVRWVIDNFVDYQISKSEHATN